MLIQLIVIQVLTFFAIVFVLRKLLYTESAREAKRLAQLREENSVKERELREKIEAANGVYKEKLAKTEEDIKRLRRKAEEENEQARKKLMEKAKAEADELVRAAVNAKEKMRDEVSIEMKARCPAIASQIFEAVLSDKVKEAVHKEFIREVINQVKKMDGSRFNVKAKSAELSSAYPLSREEKHEITAALEAKLGRDVSAEEKKDKGLVAGLSIKLGSLLIDGTLANRLRQAEEEMKKG